MGKPPKPQAPRTMPLLRWWQGVALWLTVFLLACGGAGTTTEVLAPATPSLTTQPANQTTLLGQTATFSVAATGLAPFAYQWSRDGVPIPAATAPSYTTAAAAKTDDGSIYSVVLTNRLGSVSSIPALLKVQWAPIITAQPGNLVVTEGQSAAFTVVADANPIETYQWQKDGTNIPGATQATYQIDVATLGDSGTTYRCLLSNAVGSTPSNAATLTVNPAPHPPIITGFTANPSALTLGQSTTLSWVVAGASSLSIDNGVGIVTGLSSQSVTPTSLGTITYTLTATNSAGSTPATVSVLVNAVASYPLTVSLGPGTTGTPAASASYPQGALVNYSFALQAGYQNLQVTLDGNPIAASGTLLMNGAHALATTAQPQTFSITASAGANGTITPSGTTTVAYGGTQAYTITPNAGCRVADVQVDAVSLGAITSYTFSNVIGPHTISATFIQTFPITASPGLNGTITPSGVTTVDYGANLTYAILPSTGYLVADVRIDGVSVGAITTHTFTNVVAPHTISATFILQTFSITATPGPNGTITPPGATAVNYGASQTYLITPNTGYLVTDVLVDGVSLGPITTHTFTNVVGPHSISAIFQIQTFTITATPGSNGTITPPGITPVNYGGSQAYLITPNSTYVVADVLVDGASVGAVTSYLFSNVTVNHTISATFIPIYTLTVTVGLGVTGTPPVGTPSYPQGTVVNYSYAVQTGYQNLHVTLDGSPIATSGSFAMNGPHTLAASAAIQTFTITSSAGPNGGISPASASFNYGTDHTYTITPNLGYLISDVQVDGVSVGAVTSYTFYNLSANHTIQATFAPPPSYNLNVTLSPGVNTVASIPVTSSTIPQGISVHYHYYLAVGYQDLQVTLDGIPVPVFGDVLMDGPHNLVVTAVLPELALPISVHPGDAWMKASVPIQSGVTYSWAILPGTSTGSITSGSSTGVIGFSAGGSTGAFQIQSDVQSPASTTAIRTVTIQNGTWLVKNGGLSAAQYGRVSAVLPSGRVLLMGGSGLSNNPGAAAEIYDPAAMAWFSTTSLGTARAGLAATLLADGTVLVSGGIGGSGDLASAEIYTPSTGAWSSAGGLGTARSGHTSTRLTNNKVLVVGGTINGNPSTPLASGELFDPTGGTWSSANSMSTARTGHTATLLGNGKVLVAGGRDGSGANANPELYNLAGSWSAAGSMVTGRSGHAAVLLPNGNVLVMGGLNSFNVPLASAEIYNTAGSWVATGSLNTPRSGCSVTLLTNGKVLVVGGTGVSGALSSAELYDPATGLWSPTGNLSLPRSGHIAGLLQDGTVLVAGGSDTNPLGSTEIYDPTLGTWTSLGNLGSSRSGHTATLLGNGKTLVAGGLRNGTPLSSALLYDTATQSWTSTGSLGTARSGHTATLLINGTVLVAGGTGASGAMPSAEIYNPATGTWAPAPNNMGTARSNHTATLLQNGTVLVAGGLGISGAVASAETYTGGTWAATASPMGTVRSGHTATLLQDGTTVLIAGGSDASGALSSSEVFTSAGGGTFTDTTGPLSAPRSGHTATLLQDGTVLVVGGSAASIALASTELFTPGAGTWSASGSLATARSGHSATFLPNHNVLVVGGGNESASALQSTEIYTPGSGWSLAGTLNTAHSGHTTNLLASGTVMVCFGTYGDVVTEIYHP